MTLPLFMIHRATTPPFEDLQGREMNAVLTLANLSSMVANYVSLSNKNPFIVNQATDDAVDGAIRDFRMVTPPASPTPPDTQALAKTVRCKNGKKGKHGKNAPRSSCLLPTASDPMEDSFCMKLYSDEDVGKINPIHIVIRREVLEIRRTVSGKIFFQCACCKHLPRSERARRSTLAPQSTGNLYRAIIHFMMHHVPECKHIPQEIKDMSPKAYRKVNMSGIKKYWINSAKEKGLVDGDDGRNIFYCKKTICA